MIRMILRPAAAISVFLTVMSVTGSCADSSVERENTALAIQGLNEQMQALRSEISLLKEELAELKTPAKDQSGNGTFMVDGLLFDSHGSVISEPKEKYGTVDTKFIKKGYIDMETRDEYGRIQSQVSIGLRNWPKVEASIINVWYSGKTEIVTSQSYYDGDPTGCSVSVQEYN